MKKFFLILILFFFSTNLNASSCNFSKFKIGKFYSSFEEERIPFAPYEPIPDVIALTIPMDYLCKDKNFDGTIVSLFFFNNKIIRIIYENPINKNKPLYKLANNFYKAGFKKNQKLIDNFEPENYSVEKNNEFYLYGTLIGSNENEGNFIEIFEIVDKKYEELETKESIRLEE